MNCCVLIVLVFLYVHSLFHETLCKHIKPRLFLDCNSSQIPCIFDTCESSKTKMLLYFLYLSHNLTGKTRLQQGTMQVKFRPNKNQVNNSKKHLSGCSGQSYWYFYLLYSTYTPSMTHHLFSSQDQGKLVQADCIASSDLRLENETYLTKMSFTPGSGGTCL